MCLNAQPVGNMGGHSYLYTIEAVCNKYGLRNKNYACLKYQRTEYGKRIRKLYEKGNIKERRCNMREWTLRNDGLCNTITTVTKDNYIAECEKIE